MTEKELQDAVIELAGYRKWRTYHTYDSRRSAAGFPDLVCVRDEILYIELKSEIGKLSPYQQVWRDAIETAGGQYELWRPADWTNGVIEGRLA